MLSKRSKSISSFVIFGTLALHAQTGHADDFQFFNKGVDYWNEQSDKTLPPKPSAQPKPETTAKNKEETTAKAEKFPWEHYLDPKNKEFFKEGDYTPPEPFMELVRDPSDQNMKMWFTYIEKKNELSARLQQKMADYVAKNGLTTPDDKKALVARMSAPSSANLDIRRYRLRIYFSSTCPHCEKMMGTLSELQAKGFFVEARQIDRNGKTPKLPFPSEMASPAELKQKEIQSVPLLLVGDLKKKVVYRITGFKTADEVLNAMRQQEQGN